MTWRTSIITHQPQRIWIKRQQLVWSRVKPRVGSAAAKALQEKTIVAQTTAHIHCPTLQGSFRIRYCVTSPKIFNIYYSLDERESTVRFERHWRCQKFVTTTALTEKKIKIKTTQSRMNGCVVWVNTWLTTV